jgi:hypothetical protein
MSVIISDEILQASRQTSMLLNSQRPKRDTRDGIID